MTFNVNIFLNYILIYSLKSYFIYKDIYGLEVNIINTRKKI